MTPSDRSWIEELLADDARSFRSIARETGYSDWTVRNVWRQLNNDERPMRTRRVPSPENQEETPVRGCVVVGGIAAFIGLVIWASLRTTPPA